MNSIMVFIERVDNVISNVGYELITKAKELAKKLDVSVTAVVLGSNLSDVEKELFNYGADKIIKFEDEKLNIYLNEAYTYSLTEIIKTEKPQIVLFGASAIGRDLAPRVSARVKTGLTADCTSLEIDAETNNLLMTRPAFGGNIMATIICPDHRPQMATVRPGVMKKVVSYQESEVVDFKLNLPDEVINVEILEVVKSKKELVKIEDAKIIVAGGRGLKNQDNFNKLYGLADTLNATVAASRAAIDDEYIDKSRQVGQTGKTVRPDIYFALGISGKIQHTAGMEESDLIISINSDESAPIFGISDIGVIGDANKIIPILTTKLQNNKMSN